MRVNSINCFYSQNACYSENKSKTVTTPPVFKGELLNNTTNTLSKGLIYTVGLAWIGFGLIYEIGKELLGFNR